MNFIMKKFLRPNPPVLPQPAATAQAPETSSEVKKPDECGEFELDPAVTCPESMTAATVYSPTDLVDKDDQQRDSDAEEEEHHERSSPRMDNTAVGTNPTDLVDKHEQQRESEAEEHEHYHRSPEGVTADDVPSDVGQQPQLSRFDVGPNSTNGVNPMDHIQTQRSPDEAGSSRMDALDTRTDLPSIDHSELPTSDQGPILEEATQDIDSSLLPRRLFATNRYPCRGRINSYSKPEYLLDIVEVLEGTPELVWLKASCFGHLFTLPVRKSSLSGKLVHQLLCRSLVTRKVHEMWFVFGGHPIRFSLREFGLLTGLNCGPYPSLSETKKLQTPAEGDQQYWYTLLGPKEVYSIRDVVSMLKRDKLLPKADRMDGQRRLRLALIVIVEGILVCDSSKVRATKEVAEMLKDVDAFVNFPWGRKSFERTIETVIVGVFNRTPEILRKKLMGSHTATHGLPLLSNCFP